MSVHLHFVQLENLSRAASHPAQTQIAYLKSSPTYKMIAAQKTATTAGAKLTIPKFGTAGALTPPKIIYPSPAVRAIMASASAVGPFPNPPAVPPLPKIPSVSPLPKKPTPTLPGSTVPVAEIKTPYRHPPFFRDLPIPPFMTNPRFLLLGAVCAAGYTLFSMHSKVAELERKVEELEKVPREQARMWREIDGLLMEQRKGNLFSVPRVARK